MTYAPNISSRTLFDFEEWGMTSEHTRNGSVTRVRPNRVNRRGRGGQVAFWRSWPQKRRLCEVGALCNSTETVYWSKNPACGKPFMSKTTNYSYVRKPTQLFPNQHPYSRNWTSICHWSWQGTKRVSNPQSLFPPPTTLYRLLSFWVL